MVEVLLTEVGKLVAEKLGSHVWDKVMSLRDIDSQIKELQGIKNTIQATLLDADLAQTCSYSQRDFCEKLEGVLTKIINFQDVKATKAKQKELMDGSAFTKKVRTFCSSSNQLVASYRDAREIKNITGEISQIARNHSQFGTIIGSSSVKQTQTLSNEIGSNLSTDIVVGRDGDRDNMLRSLSIASVGTQKLSVASIVGMGGVGKTTLAQYVYNDERVKGLFDVQFWVSATQDFNVKDVLQKLLASATDEIPLDCEMDQLENRVLREFAGKKFLLVLDSIWDHDSLRAKWLQLSSLLRAGSQGSIVLLTTRSEAVAKIMDTQDPYVLDDLQEGDCWDLFKHIAYTQWHEPGVEAIGKEISKMCPKVPLVIRVIGSLLAGKFTVPEWRAFQDDQLANFASYGSDVMGTLKLSYDQLDVGLKLCVAFCSLFPKGYLYKKTDVIRLWIAMGYVKQVYANQSLEDAAEKYLLCLIKRGFFRPMRKYEQNLSEYFDMHNLMHDLALSIAGFKYKMADSSTDELDERVCHVSYTPTNSGWDDELNSKNPSPWKVPSSLFRIKQLQSFLLPLPGPFVCENTRVSLAHDVFLSRFQSLRSLRIHGLGIKKLPKRLGDLLQLRYLDLSSNPFHKLPNSITQLVNLYLLNLSYCKSLKELPRDISKLVMLRHLSLNGCDSLSHMPKELARLIQLETLDRFVVNNSLGRSDADSACGLADLLQFDNLKGLLRLYVIGQSKNMVLESKTAQLENKENLTHLYIKFRDSTKQDEMVLNNLRPNANLRCIGIMNYAGERLPRWMGDELLCWLPNLVNIRIYNCKGCKYLCPFGRLAHLRELDLAGLESMEYIENSGGSDTNVTPVNELSLPPLFPSLRDLTLLDMPKLKGWRSVADAQQPTQDKIQHQLLNWMPIFPILDTLSIDLELILSMAGLLPILASVVRLSIIGKVPESISKAETTVPSNVSTRLRRPPVVLLNTYLPKLHTLIFTQECHIKDLPEEFRDILSLQHLEFRDCKTLEAIPEWIDSLISLRSLHIQRCPTLTLLPQAISNLYNLKSLVFAKCSKQLAKRCSEPTGEDWPKIKHIPNIRIEPADDEDGDVSNFFLNLDELFKVSSFHIALSRS